MYLFSKPVRLVLNHFPGPYSIAIRCLKFEIRLGFIGCGKDVPCVDE